MPEIPSLVCVFQKPTHFLHFTLLDLLKVLSVSYSTIWCIRWNIYVDHLSPYQIFLPIFSVLAMGKVSIGIRFIKSWYLHSCHSTTMKVRTRHEFRMLSDSVCRCGYTSENGQESKYCESIGKRMTLKLIDLMEQQRGMCFQPYTLVE